MLLRFNLSLDLCRGQIYDRASNMVGKKSGAATQISKIQPKALLMHCYGHSLSLAVKDLTSNCKILGDTMGTVGEITVLIKYSPKREKMLGSLIENVEGLEEGQEGKGDSLDKMSVTRWTVRANCFKKIINHYNSLLFTRALGGLFSRKSHKRCAFQNYWLSSTNENVFLFVWLMLGPKALLSYRQLVQSSSKRKHVSC